MSRNKLESTACSNKNTVAMSNCAKSTGRKRKLRNMDDLFSLLTQVKERARNLEARVNGVEEFSNKSSYNQVIPKESFIHSLEAEKSPQSVTKDDIHQPIRDTLLDLTKGNQTVPPILDEFQQPLLETNGVTMETFHDWFEISGICI
ncbi:hypothetical protein Gasu2_40570 [Galdieria sulphuraria]|nr:hypothetical protein Gasu2_40570 [Galdieria sulphuraria]